MTSDRDLRPDAEMESRVNTWLNETDYSATEAEQGLDRVLDEYPVTSQLRRRSPAWWFDRGEGAVRGTTNHDQRPGSSRRNRLLFSASGLVTAIAVVALAANLVTTPDRAGLLGAESGQTYTVSADGSGDFKTIGDAVAAAADGDTIMIRPGTYTEAVVIDKDITVMGDGPPGQIAIEAPENGPTYNPRYRYMDDVPYAFLLQDSAVTLSGLTFRGEPARVFADGGAPVLENLAFESVSAQIAPGFVSGVPMVVGAVVINGGSTATIQHSTFDRGGNLNVFEESDALILRNRFSGGPGIAGEFGDNTVISGNEISGAFDSAIVLAGATTMLVEGNTISGAGRNGIDVGTGGMSGMIRGNTVVDSVGTGISLRADNNPTIKDNVIAGNRLGINVFRTDALIANNELTDNVTGIMVTVGAPTLQQNEITGGTVGLMLAGAGTNPTLLGNTICDNEMNLQLSGDVALDTDGGDICS